MKKYKVAFLGLKGLPTIRGTDRVVENIIINLDKTKFNITIYAMKGYVPQNYKSKSFKQIILNPGETEKVSFNINDSIFVHPDL